MVRMLVWCLTTKTLTDREQDLAGGRNRQGNGQTNVLLLKSSIFTDVAINYIFDLHSDVLVFHTFVAPQL